MPPIKINNFKIEKTFFVEHEKPKFSPPVENLKTFERPFNLWRVFPVTVY
jgi:hypothetical protein